MTQRTSWNRYFMQLAKAASMRSTCPRLSVGAVIVDRNHRVLSTGYNGSAPGAAHCIDVGCDMLDGSCKRTIHAEVNAIKRVGWWKRGGTALYLTDSPCVPCAQLITKSGVIEVVYERPYWRTLEQVHRLFDKHGILYWQLGVAPEN